MCVSGVFSFSFSFFFVCFCCFFCVFLVVFVFVFVGGRRGLRVLVCFLFFVRFARDIHVERHFACSTCTTDCHRNGESSVGAEIRSGLTPRVLGSIWSLDQSTVDFWLFPKTPIPSNLCTMTSVMLSTAFRIPLSRSLLLSPSRISKTL